MKCPQCGSENAPGKLFCINCGTKLLTKVEQKRLEAEAKGKKVEIKAVRTRHVGAGTKAGGGVLLVLLVLIGAGIFFALQQPPVPSLPTSKDALNSGVAAVNRGLGDMAYGKTAVIVLGEAEANSLIEEGLKQRSKVAPYFGGGSLAVSSLRIRLGPDEVVAYIQSSFKGKPLFVEVVGEPRVETGGYIAVRPRALKVGRLPLPSALAEPVLAALTGLSSPLRFSFADLYVHSLDVDSGKVTVRVTPDKPGTNPAERLLREASTLADQGQFAGAILRLRQILDEFPDSEAAPRAREMLERVNSQGRRLVEEGQAYYAQGKYDLADKTYREVVTRFAGTTVADQAQQLLDLMKEDPLVQRYYRVKEADAVAGNIFQLGENFFRNGFIDKAEEQWRIIVEQYPESTYAPKARERLQALRR